MNAKHPEQQALSDYVSGKLDEQYAAVVESHLADCEECEVTLQAIEANSDTIVAGLREPEKSPTEVFAREAEFQRAIEQAGNLPEVTAIYGAEQTQSSAAPPSPPDARMMQKLGPYELVAKLGEGGMGAVYKAQHEHLGKTVAIKVLPATAMRDPALVGRFRREMKAVGALHHPNIVGAHDAGEAGGVHFLVMEYVAGKDLSTMLKDSGPLSVEQAISCTLQAARGLEFAHRKGIVHRDIKPANLLLDEEGTLKILDMGLARLDDNAHNLAAQEGLTQTGQVMGTVDYMAPEQAFDTHRADAKADVYSLGCTLYRLLTGQNAYAGDTIVQKILAHREKPIPSLRAARPEVPKKLDAIFQRMMAKEPEQRIGMSEVVQELAALQSAPAAPATKSFKLTQSPAAIAVQPAVQSGGGKKKIPSVWLAAGFGAAAAAILLTVVFIIRDKDGNEIARVNGPDGSSVTVRGADTSAIRSSIPPTIPSEPKSNLQEAEPKLPSQPQSEVPQPAKEGSEIQKLAFAEPDFAAWAAEVGRRDPETQLALVIKKLRELNPGYDGEETHRIQNNGVVELVLPATKIADLSPVRALTDLKALKVGGEEQNRGLLKSLAPLAGMKLERLEFYYTNVADLTPLRGMPLTSLVCFGTKVTDLGPLQGMPLELFWCYDSNGITDLSPLRGAPLKVVFCFQTGIRDLTPLADAPLQTLRCQLTQVSDLTPLRGKDIERLEIGNTKVTDLTPLETCMKLKTLTLGGNKHSEAEIDKLQKALPKCKITSQQAASHSDQKQSLLDDPQFQQWVKETSALSAENQLAAVLKKMRELNPGFDGAATHTINKGAIVELRFDSDHVTQLAPLQALSKLERLYCNGSVEGKSQLSDLGQLRGMKLRQISFDMTKVTDLAPISEMPLEILVCSFTRVTDLGPLKNTPLRMLQINNNKITDLSPLKTIPLENINLAATPVTDLSPLSGMKLQVIDFAHTGINDCSVLEYCPTLRKIVMWHTKVSPENVAKLRAALPNCNILDQEKK